MIWKPEDEWDIDTLLWRMDSIPTTSIASFDAGGRGVLISQILPGKSVEESITFYNITLWKNLLLIQKEQKNNLIFQKVVMQEDYAMGSSAEPALKEGGLDHILFGRNEQGNQHFHKWIDKVLNSDNDKELNSLFSKTNNNK